MQLPWSAALFASLVTLLTPCVTDAQEVDGAEAEVGGEDEVGGEGEVAPGADVAPQDEVPPDEVVLEGPIHDDPEGDLLAAQLEERRRLTPFHIVFGMLTWGAANVSTLLGFLHFGDRYGWDGDPASSGCATGNPIMGNEFCSGVPWPHAITVTALTLFYGSAFTLAAFMPDPLDSGEGSGEHATLLTMHRILRWTSLGMMVLQIVLGAIVSNANIEDFDTRRNVAATHLGLGTALWGVLTTQSVLGSLMAW